MHSADENIHNNIYIYIHTYTYTYTYIYIYIYIYVSVAVYKINNCWTDNLCCTEIIKICDPKTLVHTSEIHVCVQLGNNRIQVWNEDD